jgi:pilus assembly protein CpaB
MTRSRMDAAGDSPRSGVARGRRRGAVLVALALAAGGLAASRVERRERDVEARVGAPVPVVVARVDLDAGSRVRARDVARLLAVRTVPARFVPPDALASPGQAVGGRLAVAVPAGAYLTVGALAAAATSRAGAGQRGPRPGERAIEVAVAAGQELQAAEPGARVDVLVTSEHEGGRGRTYLALQDVELLAARQAEGAAAGEGTAAARASTLATLRVTVRQAVFLAAAQSFAREIRLLLRAPAERRRSGPLAVDSGAL